MRLLEESIFWEIFFRRQLRRSDLARCFHVSKPTVSRAADSLIEKGLLVEAAVSAARRGRRPALLCVAPDSGCFGGIEIDRNRVTCAVADWGGSLLGRSTTASDLLGPPDLLAATCETTLRRALEDAGLDAGQLSGIGVGCASWARSQLRRTSAISSTLETAFRVPVTIDDRSRAAALGHHLLIPSYSSHENAIYIYAGTGIGSGLFLNGRLYRGVNQAAGEVGHIVIDRNGPLCSCGKRGCVESFASTEAVLARFSSLQVNTGLSSTRATVAVTLDQLIGKARARDQRACHVLQEAGEAIGTGVANMVDILNPSLVVLTGSFIFRAGPVLVDPIMQTLHAKLLPSTARRLRICAAPFRKDIIPAGCALLAACDIGPSLVRQKVSG